MFQISVNFMAFWLSYLTYNMVVLCFDVPLYAMGLHSYIVNVRGKVVMFYLFVFEGQGQEMG